MFKAIKNWWNGLWEKEESPGPKITKEQIDRVGEVIREMKEGSFDRAKPTGTDAQCIEGVKAGQMKPFQRKHVEGKRVIEGRNIKLGTSSHVTIQRGVDGPVETEIINSEHRTIRRGNVTAHVDNQGKLLPIGSLDFDGHMEPVPNPSGKTILPGMEISFIAEPGLLVRSLGESGEPYVNEPVVGKINVDKRRLEELVAERLADPKPVPVSLDELCADTAVPTPRKPRRRGKRGGVKRNNRSKKK